MKVICDSVQGIATNSTYIERCYRKLSTRPRAAAFNLKTSLHGQRHFFDPASQLSTMDDSNIFFSLVGYQDTGTYPAPPSLWSVQVA